MFREITALCHGKSFELMPIVPLPRSKRTWALLIAALAACLAVLLIVLLPSEPSYKGKRLGYWLDQLPATLISPSGAVAMMYPISYNSAQEAQKDKDRVAQRMREAKEAVDTLGTNCLRTLVARLGSTDSRGQLLAERWAIRLRLRDPSRIPTAQTRRGQALTALARLDSRAVLMDSNRVKPILPDLLALTKNNDPGVRAAALHALRKVAPDEYQRLEEQGQLTRK